MNSKKKIEIKQVKVIERKLGRERRWGWAWEHGKIEIDSTLKGKKRLSTLCHELIHLICPEKSETQVLKDEKLFANTLWNENYRKVDN